MKHETRVAFWGVKPFLMLSVEGLPASGVKDLPTYREATPLTNPVSQQMCY